MVTVKGFTVNRSISEADQELMDAALEGDNAAVEAALAKGANIHIDRDEALHRAAQAGHTETVRLLLDRGADVLAANGVGLRWAAENGHTGTVKLLLDRGADIHADDDVALRQAAREGHAETAMLLLDRGADIHAGNNDSLRWAAFKGNKEMVDLLLDCGADIHAENDEALWRAAGSAHREIIELLLARGADLHADNDRALREALNNDRMDEGIVLLRHGADIDACLCEDNAPILQDWLEQVGQYFSDRFPFGKLSREDCFTTSTGKETLRDEVLDACVAGQFVRRIGVPLATSADQQDRQLFQDIWDALPKSWQHRHHSFYMEFTKAGGVKPVVGTYTMAMQQDEAMAGRIAGGSHGLV